jgi:lysophospholipase L1-like esterase
MRLTLRLTVLFLGCGLMGALTAQAEAPVQECFGEAATIVGSEEADVIAGTSGDDVIVALGGNDRISSGDGADVICAGPEEGEIADSDRVASGAGADFVHTGTGDDFLTLGAGDDHAVSGAGGDDVRGSTGEDYLETGDGPDYADGGGDGDYLTTGAGEDTLVPTGGGVDYFEAGAGADAITGGPETEYVDGGEGPDRISTPSGYIDAGEGSDTVKARGRVVFVEAGAGNDVVESPGYLEGGPGDDTLTSYPTGNAYLDGGEGADRLIGRGPANTLEGDEGDDQLRDGPGASQLEGGPGNDLLSGGNGADGLFGQEDDDELLGGTGADLLSGGTGADALGGGPDPDLFLGGSGTDVLRAVDGAADTGFDCGPVFEADRLVVDTEADAEVPRISCEASSPRVYSPPPPPPLVGSLYVALGDSFSSGEGTYVYDDFFGYCHRGALAWPRRFGREYLGLADSSIDHRACTGAHTTHLQNPWRDKLEDAQIHDRKQTRTELVTLTIGGNDLGFGDLLRRVRVGPTPTWGQGGTEAQVRGKLQELRASLIPIYRRLRQTYPNAQIVHVGYPRILPSLDDPAPFRCAWLSDGEQGLADWILNELNRTIRETTEMSPSEIDFVDVSEALDNHELCTHEAWMNDLVAEIEGETERGHPTFEGQIAYADAVAAGLWP